MTSSSPPSQVSSDDCDQADPQDRLASKPSVTGTPEHTDKKTPADKEDTSDEAASTDESPSGNGEASAKPPEANITVTAPSPDVGVATLEPADADNQDDTKTTPEDADADASDTTDTSSAEPALDNDSDTPLTDDESLSDSDYFVPESPPNIDGASKSASNQKPASTPNHSHKNAADTDTDTDTDGNGDEKLPEDEVTEEEKEVKEAKLESYKQFIAEQFSNKKIDYPEVRVSIEAGALPSKMYFVMNILSAIIASYGLVTNSAAVVIGAMLVAMMLGPITGIALAIIDYRMPLLRKSLFTVVVGVSLVVLVGFIVGWLHKEQPLTNEILSRTQPTSMDLMIALAGGTAGAYAMVSPHLSVAVVGVAVATALVPPLAASGILFANGEMQLGFGALLLAITNIIAIQFTNAMVLWFLGFRRLIDDDYKTGTYLTFLRRNAVTLLLLAVLGTYLTINLQTNAKQQTFESGVKETIKNYFIDKGNVLTNTQFDKANGQQTIRAVIRGETTPSSYDVRQIEAIITKDMNKNYPDYSPIKLQLRYLPVQVIESNPLTKDKLDETDAAILTTQ